jgi:redox-sensing transcriptional repressor
VDADPLKVGEPVAGLHVRPVEDLPDIVRQNDGLLGVICTPAAEAQKVADRLVEAGIRSILNFAPAVLQVAEGVSVRKVDLAIELQILAYYEQRKVALDQVRSRGRAMADLTEL